MSELGVYAAEELYDRDSGTVVPGGELRFREDVERDFPGGEDFSDA